jgi:hypothetical protein
MFSVLDVMENSPVCQFVVETGLLLNSRRLQTVWFAAGLLDPRLSALPAVVEVSFRSANPEPTACN